MSSLYKKFKTDDNSEKNGVFFDYGDYRVRMARLGGLHNKFSKRHEELMKPYRRVPRDELDIKVYKRVTIQAFVETVILSWDTKVDEEWVSGIESAEGLVPATKENIRKVLEDLPDLFVELQATAADRDNFLAQQREADAENLPPASNTP
jgi:hypothetical protein